MIDIIAIHLPKTGGSSFFEIMGVVYGEDKVKRYTRKTYLEAISSGKKLVDDFPSDLKVLQGHLYYKEVKRIIKANKSKIIIWLRDPVERVISNYGWWKHCVENDPNHSERHRINESLEVYITRKEAQNKMYKFLKGFDLKDVFFIGFLESFDKDLKELASLLNWSNVPYFHEKNSEKFAKQKNEVSEENRKKIRKLNKKDIKLHTKAQQLKGIL